MALTKRVTWEPIRSVNTATSVPFAAGSYVQMGTALANPSFILKMVNLSNVNVLVSFDGTNDYDICPANGFWLYDEDAGGNNNQFLPKGTPILIKNAAGAAAGIGLVYLVTQYIINV